MLACASAAAAAAVAYGAGIEVSLARSADDQPPEWVQIFPEGRDVLARDGRKWTLSDPATLIAAFAANQADLPLDIEHASELRAPKGEDAPAQGWIKAIAHRPGQGVFVQIDWTDEGAAAWRARRYRYVSPAFVHTRQGEILALTSVAMVTRPALYVPALARVEGQLPQDPSMSLLTRLVAALGLAATTTEDDLVTAVTTQTALAADARNPEKFVPAADLQLAIARATTAEGKLAEIETTAQTAAAQAKVDDAIAAGKLAPASREHWLSIAQANGEAFDKAVASMPAVLDPTKTDKKPGATEADADGLTADQVALCAALGVEPTAFAATLKEQA
ncbi:phage protease [Phenylobacterium sp.]|uniref:phage protease n=1 Tax=Phenylobacterium sp. TaxID=1871053 RepID=UPI00272F22A5|nr:phage protease [Phenylobacterium sp.]MDP1617335.1 phage protease [Phenylobacterium sp.]MDP1985707.1 phage protease [Phenylobacterium sp.]